MSTPFVGSGTLENGDSFEIGTDGLVLIAGQVAGRLTKAIVEKAMSLENFSSVDVVTMVQEGQTK